MRSQLEGLSPHERRVLEAAAICGPTTRSRCWPAPPTWTRPSCSTSSERWSGAGLLEEASDDRFSFRHALVSDEVERQLLGRERRLLHERALDALPLRSPASDDIAAMAHHAARCRRASTSSSSLARDGAQHYLRQGSTFQSLRLADDALREAPDDATPPGRRHRVGVADLAVRRGHLGYTTVGARSPGSIDDPEEEAAALRWRLRLHHDMGHPDRVDEERDRLADLIGVLPPGGRRARAMAAMAQSHMLQDHRATGASNGPTGPSPRPSRSAITSVVAQARIERGSAVNTEQTGSGPGAAGGDRRGRGAGRVGARHPRA